MNTATDMRTIVRNYTPGIDSAIRSARNAAMGAARDAERRFLIAYDLITDAAEDDVDMDSDVAGWLELAFSALESAERMRREMHRLIRFRRTGILA